MASSFASQIPVIVHVIAKLGPRRVLDIGKGFGKYGFLCHEYAGIDSGRAPNPELKLREQSSVVIDAVDINPDYCFRHLDEFYGSVLVENVLETFPSKIGYDLVLMLDVIEHMPKEQAGKMIRHFLSDGARILVSTPNIFFQQELYGSQAEHHVSFWRRVDFSRFGCFIEAQRAGPGTVFLLSMDRVDIRGFGGTLIKRARRVARCLLDEVRPT